MTHISDDAANARENARKHTGQFGEQEHSAPEATLVLGGTPIVTTGGPDRVVVYLYNDTNGEFAPTTLAGARRHLRMPDDESDEVVRGTLELLATADTYPPYIVNEPGYADPGEDAVLPTAEWIEPDEGVMWHEHADTWRDSNDGKLTVVASAKFDPANYGYTGHREAFTNILAAHNPDGRDIQDDETHIYLPLEQKFDDAEFTPAIVRRRMHEAFWEANPQQSLASAKQAGVLISDEDLAASHEIAGRPAAYAAYAVGRAPSDAEMVAICRDLAPTTTLRHGYLLPGDAITGFEEKHLDVVTQAANAWHTNRKRA